MASVVIGVNDSFNPWMDSAAMDDWQTITAPSKTLVYQNGMYRFVTDFWAALPDAGRHAN